MEEKWHNLRHPPASVEPSPVLTALRGYYTSVPLLCYLVVETEMLLMVLYNFQSRMHGNDANSRGGQTVVAFFFVHTTEMETKAMNTRQKLYLS